MNEMIETGTAPLTALAIRSQVNLIQEVMKEVMQEGQHFGKIPGCGDKPTLLKPGAEKLSMVFRLRPIIDNDRDISIERLDNGHREIRVYCHVKNMGDIELATGVGSCSTMESKYRYRGGEKIPTGQAVPKEYWNLKNEGKFADALEKIGGKGFGVAKIEGAWVICEIGEKMENPDIADTYNTVLKMAKKRAYVDGILSATGASDIFTQDIEDMAPAGNVVDVKAAVQEPIKPSSQKTETAKNEYADIITLLQGKVGDKMNVQAYFQEVKATKRPNKDKSKPDWDISEYTVSDLPKNPTATAVIKTFGTPLWVEVGEKVNFIGLEINKYKENIQYVAKEALLNK